MLYLSVALVYVIYIPVSLLRSEFPLFALDGLVFLGIVLTMADPRRSTRFFGASHVVFFFAFAFLFSLLMAIVVDRATSFESTLRGLRSLVLGIGVLYLSSVWIDSRPRANAIVSIILVGSVFCVLYGFRQAIFGLFPFEMERLALMGASSREMDALSRIRIPSTFGDPAAFSFLTMTGILMMQFERRRKAGQAAPKRLLRAFLLVLLFTGLGMTLTRAPMLGLAVGLVTAYILGLRAKASALAKLGLTLAAALLCVSTLDYVVTRKILEDSPVKWVATLNNVLTSVWTLVPSFLSSGVPGEFEVLRNRSADTRSNFWQEGLAYLTVHPFGGGIGNMREGGNGELVLSPVDVGILRYGLELGWFGWAAFMGLWASILAIGFLKMRRSRDQETRLLGRYLMAAWVAFMAATAVTSFLHTTVIGVAVWTIAGLLLNLDRIKGPAGCAGR